MNWPNGLGSTEASSEVNTAPTAGDRAALEALAQTAKPEQGAPPPAARSYLPELDGVRFFAFFSVFIFHGGIPQIVAWVNTLARPLTPFLPAALVTSPPQVGFAVRSNGWVGVQLFFVLSGFLITSLLLREEARFGRIDLRAFWIRRILRIWPLYYFTLLIGFFLLPLALGLRPGDAGWSQLLNRHLLPFSLFLGNWSMAIRGPTPFDELMILWSVSVEEQFYILAPLLILFVPRAARMPLVLLLIAWAVWTRVPNASAVLKQAITPVHFQFSTITQLDTLLAGVLLALWLVPSRPGPVLRRVAAALQWVVPLGIIAIAIRPGLGHPWTPSLGRRDPWVVTAEFAAIWLVFATLIAVVSIHDGWMRRLLAWRSFVWLGRISYGLYMYHILGIRLAEALFFRLPWFANKEIFQSFLAFGLTVVLASASYRLLERPFLRLKGRWTRVASRPV
jgi:peptidoglycan/LPS O-acetylase OafA/YrhL